MYVAIVTHAGPDHRSDQAASMPIVEGPVVESIVSDVTSRLNPILNFFAGDLIRYAIRSAFYSAEQTAKVRTIKLSPEHN